MVVPLVVVIVWLVVEFACSMKQKKTIAQRVAGKTLLHVGSIHLVHVKPKRPRIAKAPTVVDDPMQLPLFSTDGMHKA